jgi:hypothetical protein
VNDANSALDSTSASRALRLDPKSPTFIQDLANIQAGVQKVSNSGMDISDIQAFDREFKISSEFEKYAKEARSAQQYVNLADIAYNDIARDLKEGKSINAQSQALVVSFNRLIDPSSVVRESEYARTPEGSSFLNKLEGYKTKIFQGGAGISKEDLEIMRDTAKSLYTGYEDSLMNYVSRSVAQAEQLKSMTGGKYGDLSRVLTPDVIDMFNNPKKQVEDLSNEDLLGNIPSSVNTSSKNDYDFWGSFNNN